MLVKAEKRTLLRLYLSCVSVTMHVRIASTAITAIRVISGITGVGVGDDATSNFSIKYASISLVQGNTTNVENSADYQVGILRQQLRQLIKDEASI